MKKKICFVVMGYGVKTNPYTLKKIDLDQIYLDVIKPVLSSLNYKVIRGDEVSDCGLIDTSMYALLLRADIVVADISALNPNAMIEVGARYAMRPYHTILLQDSRDEISFDVSHIRILKYVRETERVASNEIDKLKENLKKVVENITEIEEKTDSPIFKNIPELKGKQYDYSVADKYLPKSIFCDIDAITLREKVEKAVSLRKQGAYKDALKIWEDIKDVVHLEPYYMQQYALCTYKAKQGGEETSLRDAEAIINDLPNDYDIETNSIRGAIYKRLYWLSKKKQTPDYSLLQKAIDAYGKEYTYTQNYYPAENYAFCLEQMAEDDVNIPKEYRKNLREEACVVRKKTIRHIQGEVDSIVRGDCDNPDYWALASYCGISKSLRKKCTSYERYLLAHAPQDVKDSYLEQNGKKRRLLMSHIHIPLLSKLKK